MNYDDLPNREAMHGRARHHKRDADKLRRNHRALCPFSKKMQYPSRLIAERVIIQLVNVHETAEQLRIYKCPSCNKYHLTSQTRRRK